MSTNQKYDYEWCADVVQELFERYPRGAYFLTLMWDCTYEQIRRSFIRALSSGSSIAWESKKKILKLSEKESFRDYKNVPVKDRRKYLTLIKWNLEGWALNVKTNDEKGESEIDVWLDST